MSVPSGMVIIAVLNLEFALYISAFTLFKELFVCPTGERLFRANSVCSSSHSQRETKLGFLQKG